MLQFCHIAVGISDAKSSFKLSKNELWGLVLSSTAYVRLGNPGSATSSSSAALNIGAAAGSPAAAPGTLSAPYVSFEATSGDSELTFRLQHAMLRLHHMFSVITLPHIGRKEAEPRQISESLLPNPCLRA
jgi:hypothetical protein